MQVKSIVAQNQPLEAQNLARIHDQYYPTVYRYVAYRLEDAQLCEDIASDVFLRLIEALNAKREIKDVRAWLLGTASHLVMDHLRSKYRRRVENIDAHVELPASHNLEGQAEQNLYRTLVRRALDKLTGDQQNVIALRFSQDLSIEETAQIMGKL